MDLLIVTKTIAALLLPPGGIILLLVAALVMYRRRARAAAGLVGVATALLYALSVGPMSGWLMAPLEHTAVLSDSNPRLADRQAIVVLGGGRRSHAPEYGGETVSALTLERLRYGARLHRQLNLPLAVTGGVVSGDGQPEARLMARTLREDFAVPVRWVEIRSRNTRENAVFTHALLAAEGVVRIVLVSHAVHLPRAGRMFRDQGFDVLLAPTAFYTGAPGEIDFSDWIPSTGALRQSWYALHEYLGLVWYWLRY
jgi:uncharacterized SAM-binding protein YcdF (DUF218 family)